MKATTKDLRFRTKELIETVSRGEEVVITCRGRPCAKLIPYDEESGKMNKMICLGCGRIIISFRMLPNVSES